MLGAVHFQVHRTAGLRVTQTLQNTSDHQVTMGRAATSWTRPTREDAGSLDGSRLG